MDPDGSRRPDKSALWRKNATQRRDGFRMTKPATGAAGAGSSCEPPRRVQNTKPALALNSGRTGTVASKITRPLTSSPVIV